MQRYSEKFQKEITKHLRLVIIVILTMELILVGWLEVSSFRDENTILKTQSKNNVEKWFDEQISLLESFLSYISYDTNMLKDYDTTQKYLETASKDKESLLAAYLGSPSIKTKMICSDNWIPEDDYKVEERDWYIGAMKNDGLFVSEPYVDATYGNLCISIAKPIKGTDAVMAIDIDLTTLQKAIGSFCTDLQNVTLVSTEGVIVSCPIKEYALTEKNKTKLSDTPLGKAEDEKGTLLRTSGISFYEASLQPIEKISYKLYVGVGLRNLLIKLLILDAGFIFLLFFTSMLMKKRIFAVITKGFIPFETIKKKILALSNCDLNVVFHEETDIIDIQELQDSLDVMISNLRSYIRDIDSVLSEISNDNLKVKSEIEYQGDFVAIQNSINDIVAKVRNILMEINEVSNSLNLSSEEIASAAGESGRGFAVVAEEISKLSEDTLKVNLEIDGIIKNNNEFVKEGIQIVDSTRKTLLDSLEENRKMTEQINDITRILDLLFGKISEIDKELKESARLGEENLSMTEECYAHTEELLSGSETLKGNVEKYIL